MIAQQYVRDLIGTTAYDRSGVKVGRIGQVYCDDESGEPTWVTVNTGFFGADESFVPLQYARFDQDVVTLAHDKSKIKNAPHKGAGSRLSEWEEACLHRYYGMSYTASGSRAAGRADAREGRGGVRADAATGRSDSRFAAAVMSAIRRR